MFAKFQLCQSIDLAAIQANRKNHDPDWKSEGLMAPTSSPPATNQRHPSTFFRPIAGLGLSISANRRTGIGLTPYVRISCKPST